MKIRASVSTNTQLAQGTAGSPGFAPVSYEALFFGKRAASGFRCVAVVKSGLGSGIYVFGDAGGLLL